MNEEKNLEEKNKHGLFVRFATAVLNNIITLNDVEKNQNVKRAMVVLIMYADAHQGKKFEENKKFYYSLLKADFYEILFVMFKKLNKVI